MLKMQAWEILCYNLSMNSDDKPATRGDVEEIVDRVVTKKLDRATDKILTAVGDQLNVVIDRIDDVEDNLSGQIKHVDRKLDNFSQNFEKRVSTLEKQQA